MKIDRLILTDLIYSYKNSYYGDLFSIIFGRFFTSVLKMKIGNEILRNLTYKYSREIILKSKFTFYLSVK